jgi:hypothetical protein
LNETYHQPLKIEGDKLLAIDGDGRKALVDGELCILVSLFLQINNIDVVMLITSFDVVECQVVYFCFLCWRFLSGVVLSFGQYKLWSNKVCCINWFIHSAKQLNQVIFLLVVWSSFIFH